MEIFDPVTEVAKHNAHYSDREEIIKDIIRFFVSSERPSLNPTEIKFIDSIAMQRAKIGEYRLSKKQLNWLCSIASHNGYKHTDLKFWGMVCKYLPEGKVKSSIEDNIRRIKDWGG